MLSRLFFVLVTLVYFIIWRSLYIVYNVYGNIENSKQIYKHET